ncbi:MAG: CNNM domain-containing protein [Bacteroidaceae bacterium]|nr:CNNM domain-containing protein [Bacteroidaceae bacterium]
MGLLLFYLFLALFVSFLCSILEAVLLSTPSTFVNTKALEGNRSALILKKFKQNIDKPLSAILSLNTIANTVGAAGVGAQARVLGNEYVGIVSAILTLLILIFSEIIPKTIGASYWRVLALPATSVIRLLITICYPLVWMSEFITKAITNKSKKNSISREEISAMLNIGEKEGTFESKENKIIQNIMRLSVVKAKEIMTPRTVVATASEDMTLKEFYANKSLLHYSRIPLYSNDEGENITGYILRQQVFELLAADKFDILLKDIKRPIQIYVDLQSITSIWEDLLANKEHIALIVDEYGSFVGIVTMEDVIESLLGLQILDEKDRITNMQEYARKRWEIRKAKYNYLYETESPTYPKE